MSTRKAEMDKFIEKILIGTSQKPMTTKNLSELYDIPIALCIKKIKLLEKLGLVVCVRKVVMKDDDLTSRFYRASEDKVKVHRENGRYVVKIDLPLGTAIDLSKC